MELGSTVSEGQVLPGRKTLGPRDRQHEHQRVHLQAILLTAQAVALAKCLFCKILVEYGKLLTMSCVSGIALDYT